MSTKTNKGIDFGTKTKNELGWKIELLLEQSGFERMLTLLEILYVLATTEDYI